MAEFPTYSRAETAVDHAIHAVGIVATLAAVIWLVARVVPSGNEKQVVTALIYSFGLIGMIGASAAYHLARPGRIKGALRRLDHAMIFVMIAGSYTPFALNALGPGLGIPLCIAIWVLAALGVTLKLAWPRRFERLALALYLGMGWLLLVVIRSLVANLPGTVLWLLLAGGVVYSVGAAVHAVAGRLRFHNAAWHAMVLIAAGLHLAAISRLLGGWA